MNVFVWYLDILWSPILILLPYLKLYGELGQNRVTEKLFSAVFPKTVCSSLLLSKIHYNLLWTESLLQLFSAFCAYRKCLYFIKNKPLAFLCSLW